MRRLTRHLFTLGSALSLLLCVVVCVLWVRSYWRPDLLLHDRPAAPDGSWCFGAWSTSGELDGNVFRSRDEPTPGWRYLAGPSPWGWDRPLRTTLNWHPERRSGWLCGFGYTFSHLDRFYGIWIPHWFLALLFAAMPAVRLRSIIRDRRRLRAGRCRICGYDLRASPDRCPECGTTAAK
jgi:hypothetical protein